MLSHYYHFGRMDGSIVQIGCTVLENPINSYIISEDHLNAVYLHGKVFLFYLDQSNQDQFIIDITS